MTYNFSNYEGKLTQTSNCVYDSNIGYESDFSVNGNVDGWTYYDGIHTYGCWNNFLFGTLYGDYALLGRHEVFRPVEAEVFYTVKVAMRLTFKERIGSQSYPSTGKLMWRTISDPSWGTNKEYEFELYNDNSWHIYNINMGPVQWWQGDINDLRLYPISSNGKDGDEFFIRAIEIVSNTGVGYRCLNASCSYYSQYERNCPGIGERGTCTSNEQISYVSDGTTFEFATSQLYTIEKGVNDILYVNINEYGFENIILEPVQNYSGTKIASLIEKEISKVNVGGYAECSVIYNDSGQFIIYSGTYTDDSTVRLGDSTLARQLQFYNSYGTDISTKITGQDPATGFMPYSSFKIRTHQLYTLLDNKDTTGLIFNPFVYNVEGGRRDWLNTGLGLPSRNLHAQDSDDSGVMSRAYKYINNVGKTIIDFTHPFNASGRIKKIYAGVTLDRFESGDWHQRGTYDANRIDAQLSGAKIMFFRPLKNGDIRVLPMELDISDRNHSAGNLYSATQEYVELDCDLFVNKGDLIGVYNANIYKSKSVSGNEVDALYYQVNGKASGDIYVRQPLGEGDAGLLLYARSDQIQKRLSLELDLGKRINVDDIEFIGESIEKQLEYNIARCLDINWEIDLFDKDHTTGYIYNYAPLIKHYYNNPNIYYGKENLNDGIKIVKDGLAAESFHMDFGTFYTSLGNAVGKKDGGDGLVVTNPKYFFVNGDVEWLGTYQLADLTGPFAVGDFSEDPIALTLRFPYGKTHRLYKSKIYFKEQYNFRSFALSYMLNEYDGTGNADDPNFHLIPYRTDGTNTPWTKVSLDGIDYTPEDEYLWADIDLYLAHNPSVGKIITKTIGAAELTFDDGMAYWDELGGLSYYSSVNITNNDQYNQALGIDWTILEHEWAPIEAAGFRMYCDYHESTKITEFEVYCLVEHEMSSLEGAVDITYSSYGDLWWASNNENNGEGITANIEDTPQYINIVINPITEIMLYDLNINVSFEDVYMGEKGCQHIFLPAETKRDHENTPTLINFKNVYGRPYDLYVDIDAGTAQDDGVIFFSLMNNAESITNPIIGPDAFYKKHTDYVLRNYQKNVAINCPTYALKGLHEGANVWYSHNNQYSWRYWGQLTDGKDVNFSNLPGVAITTLYLPVFTRSQWWKLGFSDPRISMVIREIKIYYQEEEITGIKFYHNKGQGALQGPLNDTAPHLSNDIIDGSYYILAEDQYIGIKLPSNQPIDKIVIYNDALLEYENSSDIAGIDSSTDLCIHGTGDTYQTDTIVDVSYYEHDITVVGGGIYCDEEETYSSYSFTEDFTNCVDNIERFSDPVPNPAVWTDLVNATIISGELYITNSGVIGTANTVDYFYNDFDTKVDLAIENITNNTGWGCYLAAFTDDGKEIRVGRRYGHSSQVYESFYKDNSGLQSLYYVASSVTENITLRLRRQNETVYCSAWNGTDGWTNLSSSTVLSTKPVRFSLISNLTPFATVITTGKFDNFEANFPDLNWYVNLDPLSSFTCTSGLCPTVSGGWANYYDLSTRINSNVIGYHIAEVFDKQYYPLDQDYVFNFEFVFKADAFKNGSGVSTDETGISVGILGHKISNEQFFVGAQVILSRDRIGIGLLNDIRDTASVYETFDTTADIYYCRFTSDGAGHYHCYIWDDGIDGSNKVADFGFDSSVTWEAGNIGIAASYNEGSSQTGSSTGWVGDINFSCYKYNVNSVLDRSSIHFGGYDNEKLLISYDAGENTSISKSGFDFGTDRFTIDFFIKFNSFPAEEKPVAMLIGLWDVEQGFTADSAITNSSWAFTFEYDNDGYWWRFYISVNNTCKKIIEYPFYPSPHRWYHFYICRGAENDSSVEYINILKNGHMLRYTQPGNNNIDYTKAAVIVGYNLDGWMEEIRVSSDYTLGGGRVSQRYNDNYSVLVKAPPTKQYKRYYTMSLYNSYDNINYGKSMEVDVLFDNSYSYHEDFSYWSQTYYTYYAIDFGQRYDIGIIRSYPINSSYQFTIDTNIMYSNKDTAIPKEAFTLTSEEQELSTDFEGQNYDYPHNWTKMDSDRASSYIIDNTFYQSANPVNNQQSAVAKSNFFFNGDFDFYIDYNLASNFPENNTWKISIEIDDINDSENAVKFERSYSEGTNYYILWVKDGSSSWTKAVQTARREVSGTLRLTRAGYIFTASLKKVDESVEEFEVLVNYQMQNYFAPETQLYLSALSEGTAYPNIQVWWDNFTVLEADPIYSTSQDARWAKIKMFNGDGEIRTVKNFGIYPDVSTQKNVVGQYNTYWTSLGTAITSFTDAENIALGATISGSSEVGAMLAENANNGQIPDNLFEECWGSEEEDNPWLIVYFTEVKQIFRFKIYHGYSTQDYDLKNIITDYKIEVSTDNETFTTVFNINDNSSFERTHDLASPVSASAVRLYVNDYNRIDRLIWINEEEGERFWRGAVLREFEIYEYYGFTTVNSEDTPIIAIDLRQNFFIESHSLEGIDSEDDTIDWDNSDSNFTWSDSNLSDPSKVRFGNWGDSPGYSKWVVIKRNTATYYPQVPDTFNPNRDTPDYLKHVIIEASVNEDGDAPNPIEYPWMWRSNVSELSYDYDILANGAVTTRTLKINYPAGTAGDHVRFVEGDHFGWDEAASWRDGLGFYLYIDDINNLDLEYGYFYFGGYDFTEASYPVVHRWNMTTLSGSLQSGWNNLNLTFLYADTVEYTELTNPEMRDPRRLYSIKWGTMGLVFRGKGNPLQINIDGTYIERNHFEHGCYTGQRGLYLHHGDMMKVSVGELNFHASTLEMWLRPDWDWDGRDIYGDFKYRTLFHIGNVANDVFGASISHRGLEIYYGNITTNFNVFAVGGFNFSAIEKVFHIAFVWSNNGSSIASDKSTIRVYLNNYLIAKTQNTWEVSDNKYFNFVLGGQGLLSQKGQGFDFTSSAVDAVVCRLKLHNYCKISFTDSIEDSEINYEKNINKPNNLIEISKDNVTYHMVGSTNLPFLFEDVPAGNSIPIWVKVRLPRLLTGQEKRTAKILGSWDIGV